MLCYYDCAQLCEAARQKITLKNADQTRANEFVFDRILDSTASQADTFSEVGLSYVGSVSRESISFKYCRIS